MFTSYVKLRGAESQCNPEGHHGRFGAVCGFLIVRSAWQEIVAQAHLSQVTFMSDGSWQRKELPVPSSFDFRWASSRVYRTALLLFDVAPPETLDNCGEMVRSQSFLYDNAWFVVYNASVRMRSEQFKRLRQRAERDHAAAGPQAARRITTEGDSVRDARPSCALLAPSRQRELLNATLHNLLWSAASPEPTQGKGTWKSWESSDRSFPAKGRKVCDELNSTAGCPRSTSDCPDLHGCKGCKAPGHSMWSCHLLHVERRNEQDRWQWHLRGSVWLCGWDGRMQERTTDSGGEQAASPLAYRCCRSPPSA